MSVKQRCRIPWFVFLVPALAASYAAGSTTIGVTCDVADPGLQLGESTTVTVSALVSPGSSTDGIFAFDLDLILSEPSVLSVVPGSVNRPDVDARLAGSDGTSQPWGINGIAGGYWEMDRGTAAPQVLFTAELHDDAVGSSTMYIGPDTDIMGYDFVLYETTGPSVDYSGALLTFDVLLPGDVNNDGVVDGLDIQPFVDLLTGGGYQAEADINGDSVVDGLDIQPFVDIITGAGGSPAPEPATLMLLVGGAIAVSRRATRK